MKKRSPSTPGTPLQATVFSVTEPPDISPASKDWEAYTNFLLQNFLAELNLQEDIPSGDRSEDGAESCLDLRQDRLVMPGQDCPADEETWPLIRLRRPSSPEVPASPERAGAAGADELRDRSFYPRLLWGAGLTTLILLVSLLFLPGYGTSIGLPEEGEGIATAGRRPLGPEFALILTGADRPGPTASAGREMDPPADHPPAPAAADPDHAGVQAWPEFAPRTPPTEAPVGLPVPGEDPPASDEFRPERDPRPADPGPAGENPAPSRVTQSMTVPDDAAGAHDECPVTDAAVPQEASLAPPASVPRPAGAVPAAKVSETHPHPSASPAAGPIVALGDCSRRPVLTEEVRPVRPWNAQRMNKKGRVVVRVLISETGHVTTAALIQERPTGFGFGEAALAAARRCRFEPALHDGRPVSVWDTVIFDFR